MRAGGYDPCRHGVNVVIPSAEAGGADGLDGQKHESKEERTEHVVSDSCIGKRVGESKRQDLLELEFRPAAVAYARRVIAHVGVYVGREITVDVKRQGVLPVALKA